MTISVALAEDHHIVRRGICTIIQDEDHLEVIHEAENGQIMLEKITEGPLPDVLVTDLDMPKFNGNALIKVLQEKFPSIKIVVLSMHEADSIIMNTLQLGAHSYILKDDAPEELVHAIEGVHESGRYFTDQISRVMMLNIAKLKPPRIHMKPVLSRRETEVLHLLAQGLSSKEISEKLFLSERTVEDHRQHARQKLGAKNTTSMVVIALQRGIIDLNQI